MLWLVIKNEAYYPREGVDDWLFCSPNHEEAERVFAAVEEDGIWDDLYLVRLEADGSYAVENTRRAA